MAIIANIIVIILEILGLSITVKRHGVRLFAYYTQLSNIAALLSSVLFLLTGPRASLLRLVSSCMLVMTFLVTLFILVPMGAGFKDMLLSGSGLYHHTLCPIISVLSYILWEPHSYAWLVPVAVTFVYGMIMLYLNWKGAFEGPYPFFKVRELELQATVLWMALLTFVIAVISFAVIRIT